jgi:YVTN family beta-propeller protein
LTNKQKSCFLAFISAAMVLMLLSTACAGSFAYITNSASNSVSIIDTATNNVTDTVPVGSWPFGVAVSPDGTAVYMANSHDGTVSVIDTANDNVTATVRVGYYPEGVTVSPDGTKVYVANWGSNTVSVIDTANDNVTATVPVGYSPEGVAVSPYGTALSSTQLDATASVPGNFSYTPPFGTVLSADQQQPLTATLTPTDTENYTTASASVTINA